MFMCLEKGEIEIGDENGVSKQFKQGKVLIPTPDQWHLWSETLVIFLLKLLLFMLVL